MVMMIIIIMRVERNEEAEQSEVGMLKWATISTNGSRAGLIKSAGKNKG